MIEIGEVLDIEESRVRIYFYELDSEAWADVLAMSTSKNKLLAMPNVGDEVACVMSNKRVFVLGAIYNDVDTLPSSASGSDKVIIQMNTLEWVLDSSTKKATLKNDESSLQKILKGFAEVIKSIQVTTPQGVSGTPIGVVIQKLNEVEQKIDKLLE